jgi:pyrroloquinoline quinone biosynthesis protein B
VIAIVLGSGIAAGFPGWSEGAHTSPGARGEDLEGPRREGAALAVSADGERYSLLEAPLHLVSTLTRIKRFAPTSETRGAPIDSLVLTSAELGACAGALAFGRALSIRIVSSRDVRNGLTEHDASFRSLEAVWTGFPWDRPVPLDRAGKLEARLFPLPGPVPDHLRELAPRTGRGRSGVRITDLETGTRLVWAPRVTRFDSATLAELRAADLRFVDGTLYDGNPSGAELRSLRPGARLAEDLGHLPIDGRGGSLAWLAGMSGESIYVHIASANPLCDPHSEASGRVRAAGVGIASDAMELER